MSADREAQHATAEAHQAVGADAQVGGIVAAIAQIRTAALAAADLSSGAGWYLGGDLHSVLCDEDAALLAACEPGRLLEILALADSMLALRCKLVSVEVNLQRMRRNELRCRGVCL